MKVVYNTCFGGFSISRKCAEWLAARGNLECINMLDDPVSWHGGLYKTPRHDPTLVLAVEHLGSQVSSGSCAKLALHVLQGDRYYIEEYDGNEGVIEPKAIEWIVV